jgi:hypothetical protein
LPAHCVQALKTSGSVPIFQLFAPTFVHILYIYTYKCYKYDYLYIYKYIIEVYIYANILTTHISIYDLYMLLVHFHAIL